MALPAPERTLADEAMALLVWTVRGGWKQLITLLIIAAGLHQIIWWMGAGLDALGLG